MKYIDSEKLIAVIERKLSVHDEADHLEAQEVGKAWNRGHRRALEDILAYIIVLQQEQQKRIAEVSEMIELAVGCLFDRVKKED